MGAQTTWAWIAGIVLVLVGLWGFFTQPILGIFAVNSLHNIIHLVTGLLFIWAATKGPAKTFNVWLGIIYLLVAVIGFFGGLSFLAVMGGNDPDNWLHLVLGLVSLLVGLSAKN